MEYGRSRIMQSAVSVHEEDEQERMMILIVVLCFVKGLDSCRHDEHKIV